MTLNLQEGWDFRFAARAVPDAGNGYHLPCGQHLLNNPIRPTDDLADVLIVLFRNDLTKLEKV